MGTARHVLWEEARNKCIGHPIAVSGLQDTEGLANTLALERAKA